METAAFAAIVVVTGLLVICGRVVVVGGGDCFFCATSSFVIEGAASTLRSFGSFFSSLLVPTSTMIFLASSAFKPIFSIGLGVSGTEIGGRMAVAGGCNTGFIRTGAIRGAGGCNTGFIRTGAIGDGSAISSSLSSTIADVLICDFADLVSLRVALACVVVFSSIFCFLRAGSDCSGDLLLVRCV